MTAAQLADAAIAASPAPLCPRGHRMVLDAVFSGRRATGKLAHRCIACEHGHRRPPQVHKRSSKPGALVR